MTNWYTLGGLLQSLVSFCENIEAFVFEEFRSLFNGRTDCLVGIMKFCVVCLFYFEGGCSVLHPWEVLLGDK